MPHFFSVERQKKSSERAFADKTNDERKPNIAFSHSRATLKTCLCPFCANRLPFFCVYFFKGRLLLGEDVSIVLDAYISERMSIVGRNQFCKLKNSGRKYNLKFLYVYITSLKILFQPFLDPSMSCILD